MYCLNLNRVLEYNRTVHMLRLMYFVIIKKKKNTFLEIYSKIISVYII